MADLTRVVSRAGALTGGVGPAAERPRICAPGRGGCFAKGVRAQLGRPSATWMLAEGCIGSYPSHVQVSMPRGLALHSLLPVPLGA